jgi:hypothetical protein
MAEVLTSFETPVSDDAGTFHARAVGRLADDHMWEGWIEFVPIDGRGAVLVSGTESRQPEREHLEYWATGLSHVYLEGALRRARNPVTVRVRVAEQPVSKAPSRPVVVRTPAPTVPEPVLDPFEVAARSSDILRQELGALNRPRLLNIIAAYDLNRDDDLASMSDRQLAEFIVVAVDARQTRRAQ